MKKLLFSCLFLGTAVLLSGCSLINSDEVKTSTLLSDDLTTDSTSEGGSVTTTPNNETTVNKVCDEKGNCYVDDGDCDSSGNCVKPAPEDNFTDDKSFDDGNCDSSGNCKKPEPQESKDDWKNTTDKNCDSSGNCWDNNGGNNNDKNWNDNGGGYGQENDCFSGTNTECKDKALKMDFRDIERMEREIKQLMKKSSDSTADFQAMLDKLAPLKESLKNVTSQDEVDSLRSQVWEIQDSLNVFRMSAEAERMQKDLEMNKKQYEKDKKFLNEEAKSADKETKAKIEEYLKNREKMNSLMENLLKAMKDGSDMDTIDSIRWEVDDIRMTMDDFWQWFKPQQEKKWAGQMFNDVEDSIKKMKEDKYDKLTDDMKAKVDKLIKKMEDIIAEGKKAQDSEDDSALQDAQDKLDEVMRKAESLFGRPKPKFEDMGFDKNVDMGFDEISGGMSYEKQVEIVKKILSANPDIIKDIFAGDKVLAERTMKIFDKVPEKMQGEFLNDKADLSSVYEEILKTNSKIANYKDMILGYNYFGNASKEIVSMLKEVRDGSLSLEELSAKLEGLKQSSKESKYDNGVVSFSDYDDSDWYYEPVEGMTAFLKGKEGDRFAGADNITFAETLKITLERFGYGQSQGGVSYAKAQNHWAKGYYAKAEELGLTLLDPDKLITRGEMARLIVEATLKTPASHSSSSFNDVDTSNQYFNYIETLKDYKIVSGDSATGSYRPSDSINRAETAKIIEYAYETLQLQTLDLSEIKDLAK
ncbi:MAG: S-layer homology domain-containing protein [Candidatus Peregrinibacteria bacterium]|nr:S-layer homology domain-containing protein [Candidatus Peregrinibacteria bacterium]